MLQIGWNNGVCLKNVFHDVRVTFYGMQDSIGEVRQGIAHQIRAQQAVRQETGRIWERKQSRKIRHKEIPEHCFENLRNIQRGNGEEYGKSIQPQRD